MGPTVVVIAMGEMGSGLARRLHGRGARIRTSLKGRSAASAARAQAAGAESFDDDRALLDGADFMLSVVPPGSARDLARRLAPALQAVARKPVYVDCNAIAPQTARDVAAILAPTGCPFADGGIVGGPPKGEDAGPRIYVSGPAAQDAATARALRSRHARAAGRCRRRLGLQALLCRLHQGRGGLGERDDPGRDASRHRRTS